MEERSLTPSDPGNGSNRLPVERAAPAGDVGGYTVWDESDEGLDWRRHLSAVFRHKLLIGAMLALGVLAGLFAYRLVSPVYLSTATVWIEAGPGMSDGQEPIRPRQLLDSYGWIDLMRSYVVLDPVVHELGLYAVPEEPEDLPALAGLELDERFEPGRYRLEVSAGGEELALTSRELDETVRAAVGEPIGEPFGIRWEPPGDLEPEQRVDFTVRPPRDAARDLARSLEIEIDGNTTFLRVAMAGTNSARVTDVVNAVVERYVEIAEELKRAHLDELTGILEEQLEYAEQNLREAELELENFKVQTISLPSEPSSPLAPGLEQTRDPVFSNYFNLKLQQEEVRRDRLAIERAMEQSRQQGRLAIEALEVIPSVRESSDIAGSLALTTEKRAELRALRLRYTDDHPAVRELADELEELETRTVPGIVDALGREIGSRQQELDSFIDEASQELQQIPPRAVEEARLERRYESAEGLFRDLQARFESARLAAASTIADVRILDRAQVPSRPESDPRGQAFLLATLAGLGLGILGAVLRDRVDPRLRYPEQVTRELGLPILGTIPHVGRRNGERRSTEHEIVVEAFRNLRLAVTYAHGGSEPLVLTVTSPGIGDGKTFCSTNLGLAFAELGHRTLVLDGDVRRGSTHLLFDRDRKPGLSDVLAGEATADGAIVETDHPALSVLPSGTRFRDGPELLGTTAMRDLVAELRDRFDVVLIDSPPMGAAVDPYLLATVSGALLVVLRNGTTDRELAEARLSHLERLPVHLLGAVLNDVPSGSGPYRYYSYLPGYGATDEELTSEAGRALAERS